MVVRKADMTAVQLVALLVEMMAGVRVVSTVVMKVGQKVDMTALQMVALLVE